MKTPFDESDRDLMRERLKAQLAGAIVELEALVEACEIELHYVKALKILVGEEDEEPP
jgi:hypothetical protein